MTDLEGLVDAWLAWFGREARDLPWRACADPYGIWVSEIMLQQTQVKTVIPYWQRWMRELPTIRALADAPSDRVLKLWEGLGYYHRARNLQKAAQTIMTDHRGEFPRRYEAVLALAGIGRYTAGAICSIAFNQPAPILDGNVMRVLSRLFAIGGNVRTGKVNERLWALATKLVETAQRRPGNERHCAHCNEALMELGALICKPKDPECPLCPLHSRCRAFQSGRVDGFPALGDRAAVTHRHYVAFVPCSRERILVRQRPDGAVNAGLWEFPNVEIAGQERPDELAFACLGIGTGALEPLCTIRHSITRYRIRVDAYRLEVNGAGRKASAAGIWLKKQELEHLAFTSAHGKILSKLREGPP